MAAPLLFDDVNTSHETVSKPSQRDLDLDLDQASITSASVVALITLQLVQYIYYEHTCTIVHVCNIYNMYVTYM